MSSEDRRLFSLSDLQPLLLSLVLLGTTGCGAEAPPEQAGPRPEARSVELPSLRAEELRAELARFETMRISEQLRATLSTSHIPRLNRSLVSLSLPDDDSRSLFAKVVEVRQLRFSQGIDSQVELEQSAVRFFDFWIQDQAKRVRQKSLKLLPSVLYGLRDVARGGFALESGEFLAEDRSVWEGAGPLLFSGKNTINVPFQVDARFRARWTWDPSGKREGGPDVLDESGWRITHFEIESYTLAEGKKTLFREELEDALVDPQLVERVRRNRTDQLVVEQLESTLAAEPWSPPHEHWSHLADWRHPALSVVDLNGDGFDDFYYMTRDAGNMMFMNAGAGTFTENAADLGLDVDGQTCAAIFADFDNDGDDDVFLGRSFSNSMLMENDGGLFVERTQEWIDEGLPCFVSSAAAVDYDLDGLLDLYVTTDAGALLHEAQADLGALSSYLSAADAERIEERLKQPSHLVLDRVGPPNVLLHNEGGGRFAIVRDSALALLSNSTQACFADYDEDGDPDVYVANAFARDFLMRNEGGEFVDVTEELRTTEGGSSRGVSWGDFDNDGDLDVYVSRTDSEGGRRLLGALEHAHPDFEDSFRGNSLWRQEEDGSFLRASASGGGGKYCDRAGAAYGAQFVDLDNDLRLDIVSLAGNYTAPLGYREGADLETSYWEMLLRSGLEHEGRDELMRNIASFGQDQPSRSFLGRQFGHLFMHHGPRYYDISQAANLSMLGDGRCFGRLDYDRDGFTDLVVANASAPGLRLYHNLLGGKRRDPRTRPRMIALRLVGGNHSDQPSTDWSNRDGYGAVVVVDTGEEKIMREHRCGEGLGAQNTSTILIGIGARSEVPALSVYWPSGRSQSATSIQADSLLSVYENPEQAPDGKPFQVSRYVILSEAAEARRALVGETLEVELPRTAPITLLIALNTSMKESPRYSSYVSVLQRVFPEDELVIYGTSTRLEETPLELRNYRELHQLPYQLLAEQSEADRALIKSYVLNTFGRDVTPATIVLDQDRKILRVLSGIPNTGELLRVVDPDGELEKRIFAEAPTRLPR